MTTNTISSLTGNAYALILKPDNYDEITRKTGLMADRLDYSRRRASHIGETLWVVVQVSGSKVFAWDMYTEKEFEREFGKPIDPYRFEKFFQKI